MEENSLQIMYLIPDGIQVRRMDYFKDLSFHLDLDAFFDSLFSDCTFMVRPQYHYVPEENPWADFGRAYFHPYQFDPERFVVNLYTIDEMRRQIEAYESNMTCLPSFAVIDNRNPVSVEGRAVEEECLLVGDSCVSLQCLKGMALETPYYENVIDNWNDGWKASIPYIKFTSLHCLALCGERQSPEPWQLQGAVAARFWPPKPMKSQAMTS